MHALASAPTAFATALLVVDDHLGLLTRVQAHAADSGRLIPVLESRTLQEALELYAEHRHRIGLVLLDLHLPDAHGLSGLSAFIKAFPDAPVVVLSGVSDPGLVRHALARGARAYLARSGDLKEVIGYIRALGLFGPLSQPENQQTGPRVPRTAARVICRTSP